MEIPFTQFLRPDGKRRAISITMPDTFYGKVQKIHANGWKFECEELSTGEASLTVFDGEEDIVIEVVPNGPEVLIAVERLIDKAAQAAEKEPKP